MMDVYLYRLEVIKGKEDIAQEWLNFLQTNKEEAREILKDEKVFFEAYFQEVIDKQMVIYLFIRCENIDFANKIAFVSEKDLDKKHFEYMNACINLKKGNVIKATVFLDSPL